MHAAVEIERVASALLIIAGLHVLKFMRHCIFIVANEVEETDAEAPRLLCEKVRLVLDERYLLPDGQELRRQQLCDLRLEPVRIQLKAGAKEVWPQNANVILTIHSEVALLGGDDEFAILRMTDTEQLAVVGFFDGAVLKCSCLLDDLLSFEHEVVEVRVIREDAHLRTSPHDLSEIVLVIRQHEGL